MCLVSKLLMQHSAINNVSNRVPKVYLYQTFLGGGKYFRKAHENITITYGYSINQLQVESHETGAAVLAPQQYGELIFSD